MVVLQNEPKKMDLRLTAILYALSDETRLEIVRSLAETDEIPCGYFDIDMPKSSLSHHFRVLRAAGVITTRKEGTALLNRLRRADLEERFPGLLDSILASIKQKKKPRITARISHG
jgi:DNA-binding transcriptional ArsR family regulator